MFSIFHPFENPNSDWCDGIYLTPEGYNTAFISANRLPRTSDTLLFRLVGKGKTQKQAIEEILALPTEDNRRSKTLQLLSTWKISIEVSSEISQQDQEDGELIMILSEAYQKWEEETERRGYQGRYQGGYEEGRRVSVENLLKARFGEIDEQLAAIVPLVLALPTEEYTPVLLQLSREELIARFHS